MGGMRMMRQDFLPPKSLQVLPDQAAYRAGNYMQISHTSYNFLIFIYELWFSYLTQLYFTALISCASQNNLEKYLVSVFMKSAPREVTKLLTRLDKKKPQKTKSQKNKNNQKPKAQLQYIWKCLFLCQSNVVKTQLWGWISCKVNYSCTYCLCSGKRFACLNKMNFNTVKKTHIL